MKITSCFFNSVLRNIICVLIHKFFILHKFESNLQGSFGKWQFNISGKNTTLNFSVLVLFLSNRISQINQLCVEILFELVHNCVILLYKNYSRFSIIFNSK